MTYKPVVYQDTAFKGLEQLAAENPAKLRSDLASVAASAYSDNPFEVSSLRFRFSGLAAYETRLAERIDPISDDSGLLRTIDRSYHFAHQVGTMLIGRPTEPRTDLPAPEPGMGYIEYKDSLETAGHAYLKDRPALRTTIEVNSGLLSAGDYYDDTAAYIAGLTLQAIDVAEQRKAVQLCAAKIRLLEADLLLPS